MGPRDSVTLSPLEPSQEARSETWDVSVRTLAGSAALAGAVSIAFVGEGTDVNANRALLRNARQSWLATLRGEPSAGSGAMPLLAVAGGPETLQRGQVDSFTVQVRSRSYCRSLQVNKRHDSIAIQRVAKHVDGLCAVQGLQVDSIREVFAQVPAGQRWVPEWLEFAVTGSGVPPRRFYPREPENAEETAATGILSFIDSALPSTSSYTVQVKTGDACGAGVDAGAARAAAVPPHHKSCYAVLIPPDLQ